MLRKLLVGIVVSLGIFILPALGNVDALRHPHLWVLFFVGVAAQLFQPNYKPVDTSAPSHDRGTATQIVWSVYLTQLAGMIEGIYFRYPDSFRWDAISAFALLMIILGFGLRTWSVRELGRFFTWHITVQPDQKVVKTGPYSFVRHPGYSGALFMYVFTLIFIHSWFSAVLAPVVLLAAFLRRIHYEENWLRRHLGNDYAAYSTQVKAIIPFVW